MHNVTDVLNLIKWDIINLWHKTKILNILTIVVIVLTLLFPKQLINSLFPDFTIINVLWPMMASIILSVYIIVIEIYVIIKMVQDLRKSTTILELTVDKKKWQILVSKIIVNILIILLIFAVGKLFSVIMEKFNTENVSYFNLMVDNSILATILSVLSTGIILYFSYVFTKSFAKLRKHAFIFTLIVFLLVNAAIGIVGMGLMILAGADIATDLNADQYYLGMKIDTTYMDANIHSILEQVANGIYVILFGYISAKLLNKKFER